MIGWVLLASCGDLAALPVVGELAGGGGDPPAVPLCAQSGPESPPARGCLSGALACGSKVSGNTLGGDSSWDDEFYASAFCFPVGGHHSGAERVYTLTAPADTQVTLKLTSTCVDLDLVAVAWDYDGRCPTPKHLVGECEADNGRGLGGSVKIQAFHERQYLVGVDGKDGAVGPFELEVECVPLRVNP